MNDQDGAGPRSFAFGCIAVAILAAVVAGGLAVIFLWDVNAL
ncbi:MAG: hypothetical protein V4701_09460 [Pseudomonadota bacterium]